MKCCNLASESLHRPSAPQNAKTLSEALKWCDAGEQQRGTQFEDLSRGSVPSFGEALLRDSSPKMLFDLGLGII